MKKILFFITIVLCYNSYSQSTTPFNYVFTKCIKPVVAGKTDTTVIDTVFLTDRTLKKYKTFTFTKFEVTPFFFDSVANKVAIFATINVKARPNTIYNKTNVVTSNKIANVSFNVISLYTASPVEAQPINLTFYATYIVLETRIIKANSTAPNTPCYYLFYKINGSFINN